MFKYISTKQVLDSANCNIPDYYIHKATSCACGDDPLRIPMERRTEGLGQKAHWCTGTLRMNDGFGNAIYVFNPFSYDELHQRAGPPGTIDRYLRCISELQMPTSEEAPPEACEKPSVPEIDEQGVGIIPLIERCRSNYQQMQWDSGAFMLYDAENAPKALRGAGPLPEMTPDEIQNDPVASCLLEAQTNKESNLNCMTEYLGLNYDYSNEAVFWRYEKADNVASESWPSDEVDACVVFSGPAKKNDNSSTTLEFRRCAHDFTETGCMIPHMVWSSSSSNKVPVAKLHTVREVSAQDRRENALAHFAEAHDMAMRALEELQNFTDNNLEVVLFSGEGDAIHQIFDCIVMGPHSRVDFWDRGAGLMP